MATYKTLKKLKIKQRNGNRNGKRRNPLRVRVWNEAPPPAHYDGWVKDDNKDECWAAFEAGQPETDDLSAQPDLSVQSDLPVQSDLSAQPDLFAQPEPNEEDDQHQYCGHEEEGDTNAEFVDETVHDSNDIHSGDIASIMVELNAAGLLLFLRGVLGGNHSEENGTIFVKRMAKLIDWTRKQRAGTYSALVWMKKLIKKQYMLISDYAEHMHKVMLRKPETLRIMLMNVKRFITWFTTYRQGKPTCKSTSMTAAIGMLTELTSKYQRMKKHVRSGITMQTMMDTNRMPPNGMADLRAEVIKGIQWAQANEQHIERGDDKELYTAFMSLVYSALYTSAPQGRVGGIMSLTIDQLPSLLTTGYATTDQFKTQATYGYQAVIVAKNVQSLIELYVTARAAILERTNSTTNGLWVTYDGAREIEIGRRVTAFFKPRLRLHITTTMIRSLVEMEVDHARQLGLVDVVGQESVQNISGHSAQVAKDYYRLMNVGRDVAQSTVALEAAMGGQPAPPQNVVPAPNPTSDSAPGHFVPTDRMVPPVPPSPLSPIQMRWTTPTMPTRTLAPPMGLYTGLHQEPWGTEHPDRRTDPNHDQRRAQWSTDEIQYIANWYNNTVRDLPANQNNMPSRCLGAIRRDPNARPIFHELHVLDSGRVSTGLKKFKEMLRLGYLVPSHE